MDTPPLSEDGSDGEVTYVRKAFKILEYKKMDGAWYETGNVLSAGNKNIFKERKGAGFPVQASISGGVRSTGDRSHGGKGLSLPGRKLERKGRRKNLSGKITANIRRTKLWKLEAGKKLKKILK